MMAALPPVPGRSGTLPAPVQQRGETGVNPFADLLDAARHVDPGLDRAIHANQPAGHGIPVQRRPMDDAGSPDRDPADAEQVIPQFVGQLLGPVLLVAAENVNAAAGAAQALTEAEGVAAASTLAAGLASVPTWTADAIPADTAPVGDVTAKAAQDRSASAAGSPQPTTPPPAPTAATATDAATVTTLAGSQPQETALVAQPPAGLRPGPSSAQGSDRAASRSAAVPRSEPSAPKVSFQQSPSSSSELLTNVDATTGPQPTSLTPVWQPVLGIGTDQQGAGQPAHPAPIAATTPTDIDVGLNLNQAPSAEDRTVERPDREPASAAYEMSRPVEHQPFSAHLMRHVDTPQGAATTTPGTSEVVPRQVAAQLAPTFSSLKHLGNGVHQLVLHVAPDAIGPIRVVAEISGSQINLSLQAGSDQARNALQQCLDQLRQDLAQTAPGATLDLGTNHSRQHPRDANHPQHQPGEERANTQRHTDTGHTRRNVQQTGQKTNAVDVTA